MNDVCVAHLVRRKNGTKPFMRFLSSYEACRGGMPHDLIIIFKGFKTSNDVAPYLELLKGIDHRYLLVSDYGFDIRAYIVTARAFDYAYYCFLNSYSYFLDPEWLIKMYRYISSPRIGLVGASGSYESEFTNFMNGLSDFGNEPWYIRPMKELKQWKKLTRRRFCFNPYPNYHIRTNGFMISGATMRKIRCGVIINKRDAYRFESGKNSLSNQVIRMGLKLLVVGRDGRGYEKEEWHASNTFRHGTQGNLLIGDKQTDLYMASNQETKNMLCRFAWGIEKHYTNDQKGSE